MLKYVPLVLILSMITLAGCGSAKVDRTAAQATSEAPEAAQVAPPISIADDPSAPTYVVAVEPFEYGAVDIKSGGSATQEAQVPGQRDRGPWGWYGHWYGWYKGTDASHKTVNVQQDPSAIGPGLAAQLLTALSNDANIQLIDVRTLKTDRDGIYNCKLEPGERGPFIVRGMVTEFSETSDMATDSKGGSLGVAGVATGILGAVTGSNAMKYAGFGTAAANPTYSDKNTKRTGMVGIDMQILNGSNGRIVAAVQSTGSFTTVSAVNGMSVFGIGSSSTDFAASAIGQATRMAMNDAVVKINQQLTARVK